MRKICVVTGSRAEYGLLFWLMKEIQSDPCLELQVAVTGMHLLEEFGNTYKTIETDGFPISAKVESPLRGDTSKAVTLSLGATVENFAKAWEKLRPDLIVLLGDRYEILAAAQSALIFKIPIAHIHGGEITEGNFDDAFRHSMTKMAHLHFVSAEPYKKRVVQLGENPERVFNFGAPGLDAISKIKLLNKNELEQVLNFKITPPTFLVTYHPVTLDKSGPEKAIKELLIALDQFPQAHIIFTKANSDTGGKTINEFIYEYVEKNKNRTSCYAALGHINYLSLLQHIDAVIGNSSSGLVEVPVFKKPTINMGDRQKGRLRPTSVLDCEETSDAISRALKKALAPEFQKTLSQNTSPVGGDGKTSFKIKEVLKSVKLEGILMKKFYDLPIYQ